MINYILLIPLLIHIESSGRDYVVGDNGTAVGCLQITAGVIEDVNRIYKTDYTKEDCYNRKTSSDICIKYLSYWLEKAVQREQAEIYNPYEMACRIWNGGPRGYQKESTEVYWEKIKRRAKEVGTYDVTNYKVSNDR